MPSNATRRTLPRMFKDKPLRGIKLNNVLQKRRLDQALNAKEFAVLTGISYSTARAWFRLCGFPAFRGVVFWLDFVQWRKVQTGLGQATADASHGILSEKSESRPEIGISLPVRAARILSEAG